MKKKFTGFLICFMMLCTSILAGCSLVEPNYDYYYNQTVAVVEDKETGLKAEITKKDLLSAYQSYGYTYEQYYGKSREEALKSTLELLENRKITLITAEKKFDVNEEGKGLSEKEKTFLYQQVVDSINQNLKKYYDEIIGKSEEKEEDSDAVKFNGYEKKAELNEDLSIHKIEYGNKLLDDFTYDVARDFYVQDDYKLIYENMLNSLYNDDYVKAFDHYYKDLKISEYGTKLKTDAKSVFDREIKRLYKVIYENYVIEKYSESNKNSESISSVTASQIVKLYTSRVRASYTQYVIEKDAKYDENVQKSLNKTYYFKNNGEATKFFTVANVLFKFSTEQEALYKSYKEKYEAGDGSTYSYSDYQKDLDSLYSQITPVLREYNEETGVYEEVEDANISIADAYSDMKNALVSAQTEGDINKVGDTINDFIYKYNEDPGMFNAENNYVIGVDKDGKAVSSFVPEFNDASIELYNKGNAKIGDITGYVRTEFGIHVMIYTGKCENLFDGIDSSFELSDEAVQTLFDTRINVLVDKTYFDALYDEIYTDNYQYFENANMNFLRKDFNITEYNGRYSELLG